MLTKANPTVQHAPDTGMTPGGGKVRCPFCHRDNTLRVTNSRLLGAVSFWIVRRTRFCEHCHKQFSTYEMLESVYNLLEKARSTLAEFRKLLGSKLGDD